GEMADALAELEQVFALLEAFGVRQARLNLGIARGLDYYSGIVFELHCPILGAEKQLLGGGGYDLSQVFGGAPTPTMGFGLGFDRSIVALQREAEAQGRELAFGRRPGPELYVGALSDAAIRAVLPVVAALRRDGHAVDLDLMCRKAGAIAKHADHVGARHLAIVGDRDLAGGRVQVKELATGAVRDVPLEALRQAISG
ncbi:MAG TPA: ATP phosphoribosyltransferase regulatory subunit, partial [Candidatus Thermoplasmatota archaeon]|nr:ATP phosphoribosyltransferase regulatory subunit [Candidatus Thermoplasmatota archaeon]